jgi:uncharacterized membrane protein YdjX (TVP38/TMEM64 family)
MIKIKNKRKVTFDVVVFIVAVAIAFIIATSETFQAFVLQLVPVFIIAELIAGGLYTSFLTVPISISLFSVMAQESSIWLIVFIGAIGATIGDFIIMNVFHKTSQRVQIKSQKWKHLHKNRTAKAAMTALGLLCLAAPVPDEVAMSILGITRISIKNFILLVYPAKAFGIFLVVTSLQAL